MQRDGMFGRYGGFFVSELLIPALEEMEAAWLEARVDPEFQKQLRSLLASYAGRPTPLYRSRPLSTKVGCEVYLKREDLLHGGAHKTNNTIGQALLAHRMGKRRLIAETGAGQHGVATAMAGALFGLDVEIFMGAKDVVRQAPNVKRMEMFGARVRPVTSGSQSLKDAINDTLREWTGSLSDTFYVFGTVAGPHPFPSMVRDFQRVIGDEARVQCIEATGRLPSLVTACVGGGSNAAGIFAGFIDDAAVRLVGVEPAGEGIETGRHGAPLGHGVPGCVHGSISYVLQDGDGQILEAHSVSAGLDYPGVGPEHSALRDEGRAEYVSVTDDEALDAFVWLSRNEGILPALESSHAIAYLLRSAGAFRTDDIVIVNLSGRGDKDLEHVSRVLAARGGSQPAHRDGGAPPVRANDETPQSHADAGKQAGEAEVAAADPTPHTRERLSSTLAKCQAEGRVAFVPFLVAGDPGVETTVELATALIDAGADVIELGFPFSDPPADGPVIQAADVRALDAGVTVDDCFAAARRIRERHVGTPITLLIYHNLVFRRGEERFFRDCAAAGIDGVLIADLPLEAAESVVALGRRFGVANVFVASELSSDERMRRLATLGSGYVYVVARVGTTGERTEVASGLGALLERLRGQTSLPLLVGFGVSTPSQAAAVAAAGADGVIIGSAIVRRIEENLTDIPRCLAEIAAFGRAVRVALDAAT